jgi:hypothetical protein
MQRIGLAVVLTFSVLAAPLLVEARQARKVYRIGVLEVVSQEPNESRKAPPFPAGSSEIQGPCVPIM